MALANPMYALRSTFTDKCGTPLAGGKVYTYENNSLIPKATFTDAYMEVPNTNPIVLDEAGGADIFLDGDYRIQVFSRNDTLIDDRNGISNIIDLTPVVERLNQFNNDFQTSIQSFQGSSEEKLNEFQQTADSTLVEFQNAINTAAAAGAGENGWLDSLITTENGRTQREKNFDHLNLLDFLTPSELVEYKSSPDTFDISEVWNRAVFSANYLKRKLYGAGEFLSNSVLYLYCDADLSCLTINSYVADISLKVANIDSTTLSRKTISLPKVISKLKNGKGWDTAGNIGIQTLNLNACEINVPYIDGFKIGLNCHASNARGNCYSNYFLMHLNNNKVNHQVSAENDGAWTNENKFFGGRFSHLSSEGTNIVGCRHIFIKAAKNNTNQNIWFSPSIEGNTPEYHAEIQGSWNAIYSARWEAQPPKVLFSIDESLGEQFKVNQASKNLIFGGYQVDNIVFTTQGAGSAFLNRVTGMARDISPITASSGGNRIKNSYSNGSAIETIFSSESNIYEVLESDYIQQKYPQGIRGKKADDLNPRVEIKFDLGEIRLGNGIIPFADMAVIKTAGTALSVNKTFIPVGTAELGASTAMWPRIFAAKYMYSATVGDFFGAGSPEGSLAAGIGSTYRRSDGSTGTCFYIKETGTGNTGWIAK